MATYYDFSEESVGNAVSAAKSMHAEALTDAAPSVSLATSGELSLLAECISVTIEGNKVCVNLPLGIGSVCLPIPISIPNGTAAEACLSICTTWGIPTGVKVTVSAHGHVVVEQSFGKC